MPLHCWIQNKQIYVFRVYPEQQRSAHRQLIFQYEMALPKSTSHYIIFHNRSSVSRQENYLFNRFSYAWERWTLSAEAWPRINQIVCDRPVPLRCFKLRRLNKTIQFLISIGNVPGPYLGWYIEISRGFSQSLHSIPQVSLGRNIAILFRKEYKYFILIIQKIFVPLGSSRNSYLIS